MSRLRHATLVPRAGIEPARRVRARDFKSRVSTYSTTEANGRESSSNGGVTNKIISCRQSRQFNVIFDGEFVICTIPVGIYRFGTDREHIRHVLYRSTLERHDDNLQFAVGQIVKG